MVSVKAKSGTASGGTGIMNLTGWSITETAGAPAAATVNIRAGGAAGPIIFVREIEANGDDTVSWAHPVDANASASVNGATLHDQANSWYFEITTGTVRWTACGS